ncbi:M1 family metallopeptidase [Candidatus Saccharibacteria bacterium]|nr:M1 family metallopeptidase [Candidatus Saccharibacteria bacterium]
MKQVERLIKYFVPKSYRLELTFNKAKTKAFGVVNIEGTAKTTNIKLHAKNLKIERVTVQNKSVEFTQQNDELQLHVPKGLIHLSITYNFELHKQLYGAYLSEYNYKGNIEKIITTQFESHYAREALPCIDEPASKAMFTLTIINESVDDMALSNMPTIQECIDQGRKISKFEQTPPMSTYLLAFIVGKFHKKTSQSKRGIQVNAYCSLAQPPSSLDFALNVACQTLDFYESYFGTKYPLPKCDQVALPDFDAGAMENWGLVTYRESAMLVDEKLTSISTRRYVLTVITHELSHQWFGNLVTMQWWDDLWLNESFASVIEYVAADHIQPTWDIWQDFITGDVVSALRRDCVPGVQAVHQDVSSPDEIGTLFDGAIVYAKGARLIYMLIKLMGEDKFKAGLKMYFKKFAYKNTVGDDLWAMLNNFTDFDVKQFMDTWITQPGYPVVDVKNENGQLELAQSRFMVDGDTDKSLWPIPLGARDNLPKLMTTRQQQFADANQTIRLNHGAVSHFITCYSDDLFSQILGSINQSSQVDNLGLLIEQSLLAKSGKTKTIQILELLKYFSDDQTEAVWSIVGLMIRDARVFISKDTPEDLAFDQYINTLTTQQFNRLGFDKQPNEPEEDEKLRVLIYAIRLSAEDQATINDAIKKFNQAKSLEELDKNQRPNYIWTKVRHDGSPQLINSLLKIYKTTENTELRSSISSALCGSRNKQVISQLIRVLQDGKTIRKQDLLFWIADLLRNSYARDLIWQLLRDNWPWVEQQFGNDQSYDYIPRFVAGNFKTKQQLAEYRALFTPMLDDPVLTRVITMGITEIEARIKLIASQKDAVAKYLLG